MLATFGCSHTWHSYEEDASIPWPERLGEKLGLEVDNYAVAGYSNDVTFRHVNRYLAMGNRPDLIVIQWTELKRYGQLARGAMFDWDHTRVRTELPNWKLRRLGKDERHPEFLPEQEMLLVYMSNIQRLCNDLGIPVYFMCYCNLNGVSDSPLWGFVDQSKILHENYDNGWDNHCAWVFGKEGFMDFYGHLSQVAIDYTADCLYNHITNGTRYQIEEVNWWRHLAETKMPYDYTEFK